MRFILISPYQWLDNILNLWISIYKKVPIFKIILNLNTHTPYNTRIRTRRCELWSQSQCFFHLTDSSSVESTLETTVYSRPALDTNWQTSLKNTSNLLVFHDIIYSIFSLCSIQQCNSENVTCEIIQIILYIDGSPLAPNHSASITCHPHHFQQFQGNVKCNICQVVSWSTNLPPCTVHRRFQAILKEFRCSSVPYMKTFSALHGSVKLLQWSGIIYNCTLKTCNISQLL